MRRTGTHLIAEKKLAILNVSDGGGVKKGSVAGTDLLSLLSEIFRRVFSIYFGTDNMP